MRNYRNKFNAQQITFGKAFKTGLFIALAGSVIYVISGMLLFYVFMPGYMDQYAVHVVHNATIDGKSAEEIAKVKEQMAGMKELYKNPLFAFIGTLAEVLVPGVIVALISALILRTRNGAKTMVEARS